MLSDDNQQPRSSLPRPTAPTFRKERLEHLVSQDSSIPFSKPVLRAHCEACALHPAHHSIHGPLIKSYQKPTTAFLLKQKQSNPNHHTQQQYWRPSGAVKHGLHPVDSSPSTKYSNNSPLPHSHSLSLRRRSSAHALHGTSSSSSFSGRSKLARKLSASSLDANFINSWRPSGKVNYPHPPFDIEPIKLGNSNITGHRWFSEPRNSSGSKSSRPNSPSLIPKPSRFVHSRSATVQSRIHPPPRKAMSLSNLLQNQPYQRSRRQSTSTSCQTDPLEFPNSLVASSSVIETTLTEDNVVLLEKEVETVDCEIVISEEEEVILQAQPLQGIEHKSSPPNAGPIFMDEGVQVDYQHFDTPTVQQPLTVAVVENSTSTTDDIVDSVIDNINNTSDSTTSITNSALSAAVVALGGVAGAASAAITTAVPVIASVAPASALATGTGVLIAQAVVVGAAAATATAAVAAVMTVASKENGDQEDESLNCNQMHEDIDQRDDLPGQAPHEELAETETDSSSPPATILHQEEVSLLSTFEDNIKNSGVISSVNNSSGIKNHNENSFVNDDFVHDFLQPIVELAAKNAFPLDTLQKPIRIDGVLEFDENGVVIEHEEEMTTNMHENEVQGEISEVSLSYTSSTPLSSPISRPGSCGSSEGISARRSSSASTSAFSNNSATASSTTSAAERASWKQSIKRRARRPSVDMRDFAALALAISSRFSELESCHKLMHTLSSSVVPTGMFTSSSLPSSFSSFSESTRISPALRAAKQSYISTAHGIVELGKGINRAWLPIAAGCTDSVLRHQLVSALTKLDTLSSQMRAVAGSKDADLGDIDTSASVVSAARNVLEASSGALSALEAANVCFTGRDQ